MDRIERIKAGGQNYGFQIRDFKFQIFNLYFLILCILSIPVNSSGVDWKTNAARRVSCGDYVSTLRTRLVEVGAVPQLHAVAQGGR
jgi:hypothetical protein